MPLIVSVVNATGLLPAPVVTLTRLLVPEDRVGSMACNPLAPVPGVTVKPRAVPFQDKLLKEELLRPSSQVSI